MLTTEEQTESNNSICTNVINVRSLSVGRAQFYVSVNCLIWKYSAKISSYNYDQWIVLPLTIGTRFVGCVLWGFSWVTFYLILRTFCVNSTCFEIIIVPLFFSKLFPCQQRHLDKHWWTWATVMTQLSKTLWRDTTYKP